MTSVRTFHIGRVNISQQLYSWRVKHFDIDRCATKNILHDPFKVNFLYLHYARLPERPWLEALLHFPLFLAISSVSEVLIFCCLFRDHQNAWPSQGLRASIQVRLDAFTG